MELNKIYNEDCLVGMKMIPDASVDLVVTSPPYDNLRTYGHLKGGFTFEMFKPIAKELSRILKEGGVIVWNVNDATIKGSETCTSFRQVLFFKDECGLNLHDTMIYQKQNPIPQNHNRYEQSFEYMFVFSKGKPKTFNAIRVKTLHGGEQMNWGGRKTEMDVNQCRRHRNDEYLQVKKDKPHTNIFCYSIGGSATGHPAVFPYQLARDHVVSWSNENDVVLDPFIGSGTTAIAAVREHRKFIGFEISEEYFKKACERIKKEQKEAENSLLNELT